MDETNRIVSPIEKRIWSIGRQDRVILHIGMFFWGYVKFMLAYKTTLNVSLVRYREDTGKRVLIFDFQNGPPEA